MDNKKVKNSILGGAVLGLSSMAANAETFAGLELRWDFNDAAKLGLVVKDVEFRDIKTSSVVSGERLAKSDIFYQANAKRLYGLENAIEGVENSGDLKKIKDNDDVNYIAYSGDAKSIQDIKTLRTSNEISGFGIGVHSQLNKNWNKPTVELTGLLGKVDFYGEVGIGYDFNHSKFTIPTSITAGNFSAGTNLRNPVEDFYLGVNTFGSFDKFSESSSDSLISTKSLCKPGQVFIKVSNHNGTPVNYSGCSNVE